MKEIGQRILVTGAGGFIGHHLVGKLKESGFWVRGADIKEPEYEPSQADEFLRVDLRDYPSCLKATKDIELVFNFAADMGGIGYISQELAKVARNNTLINCHMLEASRVNRVKRFLFSSSACVYPKYLQESPEVSPLKEEDAYPADPESGYGWEKLYSEEMCHYYRRDFGLETRIVRFHNVYGPLGSYDGGREKAPAAICRKVALAEDGDEIEIWGDGEQTRSFMYITDCLKGLFAIMTSDHPKAFNLGSTELVTVNQLVDIVSSIAGKRLTKKHDLTKPQGVRGRNSDNSFFRKYFGWEPSTPLAEGLAATYPWIAGELRKRGD